MRFIFAFIGAFFFSIAVFGQNYSQKLVDSFCNLTIQSYYNDFVKPYNIERLNNEPTIVYILNSDETIGLDTQFTGFSVHYVTKDQLLDEIVYTKERKGSLEAVSVMQLNDTVSIGITTWYVEVTKVKRKAGKIIPFHSTFGVSCGMPTCRFVFDRTTNSWMMYKW